MAIYQEESIISKWNARSAEYDDENYRSEEYDDENHITEYSEEEEAEWEANFQLENDRLETRRAIERAIERAAERNARRARWLAEMSAEDRREVHDAEEYYRIGMEEEDRRLQEVQRRVTNNDGSTNIISDGIEVTYNGIIEIRLF